MRLPDAIKPRAGGVNMIVVADLLLRKCEEGMGGSLGIGIATKEFCLVGPLPSGPLLSTSYLWTSETRSYVVVPNDLDLRQEPTIAAGLSDLGPC